MGRKNQQLSMLNADERKRLDLHRKVYHSMVFRCYSEKFPQYKDYGGRGIQVCERWRASFYNFLDDMGFRPEGDYQLDRIDNDGNYEPTNCRWVTRQENMRNKRAKTPPTRIRKSSELSERERSLNFRRNARVTYRRDLRRAASLPIAPHVAAILNHYR